MNKSYVLLRMYDFLNEGRNGRQQDRASVRRFDRVQLLNGVLYDILQRTVLPVRFGIDDGKADKIANKVSALGDGDVLPFGKEHLVFQRDCLLDGIDSGKLRDNSFNKCSVCSCPYAVARRVPTTLITRAAFKSAFPLK